MDIVFASGQRSLESLCIAFATTDRLSFPAPNADVQEAADGVIRLLGSRKKLSSHDRVSAAEHACICAELFAGRCESAGPECGSA